MECNFNYIRKRNKELITIVGEVVQRDHFQYLGSIMHNSGGIKKEVAHKINTGWLNKRNASRVLL